MALVFLQVVGLEGGAPIFSGSRLIFVGKVQGKTGLLAGPVINVRLCVKPLERGASRGRAARVKESFAAYHVHELAESNGFVGKLKALVVCLAGFYVVGRPGFVCAGY
jgi:hypothetical protein